MSHRQPRTNAGRRAGSSFALLVALGATAVHAASFAVDSVADGADAAPGNGACATAGGACTLRAAVMEANALAGPDRVLLAAQTYQLSLAGGGEAAGDLDLATDLEIAGAGSTIVAAVGIERVLEVSAGSASLHDLVLRPLGASGNPSCLLSTASLTASGVRCDPPLFFDGFETGDLSRWSSHVP